MDIRKKIILLGDSITAGYKDGCVTKILTDQVARAFPAFDVIGAGIPGDTSQGGAARLERNVLKYDPTLVLIFFGANDIAKHHHVTAQQYEKNIIQMVTTIGSGKCILISPPFFNECLYEDRSLADAKRYRDIVMMLGEKLSVDAIDLFSVMQKVAEPKIYLQGDGLHFSEKGYHLLAELYNKAIKEKLGV